MIAHAFAGLPSSARADVAIRVLFLTQALTTLAMFGLIWFVQVVHYPLFLTIGESGFLAYETNHATRTGWIAAPLMTAELLSALLLLLPQLRPVFISRSSAEFGAWLVVLLWLSTGLLQVPLHNRLHRKHHLATIRKLIHSNWLRTVLWTARAGLILAWIGTLLHF